MPCYPYIVVWWSIGLFSCSYLIIYYAFLLYGVRDGVLFVLYVTSHSLYAVLTKYFVYSSCLPSRYSFYFLYFISAEVEIDYGFCGFSGLTLAVGFHPGEYNPCPYLLFVLLLPYVLWEVCDGSKYISDSKASSLSIDYKVCVPSVAQTDKAYVHRLDIADELS